MQGLLKRIIPRRVKRAVKLFGYNVRDSILYYCGTNKRLFNTQFHRNNSITSIIFVCKGNVCRSIFAEHRLRCLVDSQQVHIDSCGIDVDQGNCPPRDAVNVAAEFYCSLERSRSKRLDRSDIFGADLICAMEYWQYKRLVLLYPEKEESIMLLRNFAPFPYRIFCNIDDPYGYGNNEFQKVFIIIDKCLARISKLCSNGVSNKTFDQ